MTTCSARLFEALEEATERSAGTGGAASSLKHAARPCRRAPSPHRTRINITNGVMFAA